MRAHVRDTRQPIGPACTACCRPTARSSTSASRSALRSRLLSYFRCAFPEDKGARILRDAAPDRVGLRAERVRRAAPGAAADQALSAAVQRGDEARRPELLFHQDHAGAGAQARRRSRPRAGRLLDLLRSVHGRHGRWRSGARAQRRARPARLRGRSAHALRRSAGAVRRVPAHAGLHPLRGEEVSRPVRRRLLRAAVRRAAHARARLSRRHGRRTDRALARARWRRRASASSTSAPRCCATS